MHSILHKVTIESSPEALYQAIATKSGLCAWWTKMTNVDGQKNVHRFFFGPNDDHQVDMEVMGDEPSRLVQWQCIQGPWADKGLFHFQIDPDERGAVLRFRHDGWAETDDFYQHCNAKWGFFLVVSLKNYLETGKGQPHPMDPSI